MNVFTDVTVSQQTHLHIEETLPIGVGVIVPDTEPQLFVTFGDAVHQADSQPQRVFGDDVGVYVAVHQQNLPLV